MAVTKETESRLLTVWPLKLGGAVAPGATGRKESEDKKSKGRHRISQSAEHG